MTLLAHTSKIVLTLIITAVLAILRPFALDHLRYWYLSLVFKKLKCIWSDSLGVARGAIQVKMVYISMSISLWSRVLAFSLLCIEFNSAALPNGIGFFIVCALNVVYDIGDCLIRTTRLHWYRLVVLCIVCLIRTTRLLWYRLIVLRIVCLIRYRVLPFPTAPSRCHTCSV